MTSSVLTDKKETHYGLVGLGVMGRNLALNIARHGFPIVGFDLDKDKQEAAQKTLSTAGSTVASSLDELMAMLQPPRRVILMVPAGKAVDDAIKALIPLCTQGDVIVDGGNSFFKDTERREITLREGGLHFIGSGVSGGEAGALLGPAIMPGGSREAYAKVEDVLTAIAARTDEGPCCAYMGAGAAGHFVKMVHNGIEYAIMQLIGEAYALLGSVCGLSAAEQADLFATWNQGELASYLIEITAAVLAKVDEETGLPMVDVILDSAGQKGTGKWTSQAASDLGIAVPAIDAALHSRMLSALKRERVATAAILGCGGLSGSVPPAGQQKLPGSIHDGLHLAILAAYAQGFALMKEGSREYGYGLELAEIARVWKGGCIIRSRLLNSIRSAYLTDAELPSLLTAPVLTSMVRDLDIALRQVVLACVHAGIPCPAFSATLAYLDAMRSERLPANLLQAQRDYFGAHTYKRIDKPADISFHTQW